MPSPKLIAKYFGNFLGLHKGFTDINRPDGYAIQSKNVLIDENGDAIKRAGSKLIGQRNGGLAYRGLIPYRYIDSSGAQQEELLSFTLVGSPELHRLNLVKLRNGTLTVTYSGAATLAEWALIPTSSGDWFHYLIEDGVTRVSWPDNYGDGIEISSDDIALLQATVDGLADYVATLSTLGDLPGNICTAQMDLYSIDDALALNGAAKVLNVPHMDLDPAFSMITRSKWVIWEPDFVNPQGVNMNNIVLVAMSGDYLFKYDNSKSFYRAGMPEHLGSFSTTLVGAGSLTGRYLYHFTYLQYDAQGNIVEGSPCEDIETNPATQNNAFEIRSCQCGELVGVITTTASSTSVVTCAGGLSADVKVGDIIGLRNDATGIWERRQVSTLNRSTGVIGIGAYDTASSNVNVTSGQRVVFDDGRSKFNIRSWEVNGNQTGVTAIAIDTATGQDPRVGDTVYFLDRSRNEYTARTVTVASATSITISGNTVNVNDGDVISLNLRIAIYRSFAEGTEKYFIAEIPNNGIRDFTSFTDATADASLGFKYIPPEKYPGPAPKAIWAIAHQGLLVVSDGQYIRFSEPSDPENFPEENVFRLPFSQRGDDTGLGIDAGNLVVFKKYGRAYIFGDLAANNFTAQVFEDGVGCESGHTIQQTPVGLVFLSHRGFERLVNGALDLDFNRKLSIDFVGKEYKQVLDTAITTEQEELPVLRRAVSVNDYKRQLYICYVPCESGTPTDNTDSTRPIPNSNSKWYVYDYFKDRWGEFDYPVRMNAVGGLCHFKNEIHWASFWKDGNHTENIFKEMNREDEYDAVDHYTAINFILQPTWDGSGEISSYKKFERLKIWLAQPSLLVSDFTLTVKTYRSFLSSVHSQFTRTFTAAGAVQRIAKLKPGKCTALSVEFSNNVFAEKVRISGYEYEVLAPYEREIKE